MPVDDHYLDPKLVALYDLENPRGADTDFFANLARQTKPRVIADVGCGTGTLTIEMAPHAEITLGIDPAPAMLNVARQKPGADCVIWIEGDARAINRNDCELVTMSSCVFQVFLSKEEVMETLVAINHSMSPGGVLAFETRNPLTQPWRNWGPEVQTLATPAGRVETWMEILGMEDNVLHFRGFNRFAGEPEPIQANSRLKFWTPDEVHDLLDDAGFAVEEMYSDWHGRPFTEADDLMIVLGRKRDSSATRNR